MDGNSFPSDSSFTMLFSPRETLALYIKPFHQSTLTNKLRYTEQTRSSLLRPNRLPPVPATFCAATQNKRLQPRAEFRARTHQNTTPLHHVVIKKPSALVHKYEVIRKSTSKHNTTHSATPIATSNLPKITFNKFIMKI